MIRPVEKDIKVLKQLETWDTYTYTHTQSSNRTQTEIKMSEMKNKRN